MDFSRAQLPDRVERSVVIALSIIPVVVGSAQELSDSLDNQAAGGNRTQQLGFRTGQVQPSHLIRPVQHNHLSIVDRRYIRAGLSS